LGCRRGFTLIEVMVAVMIVSVVIGAIFKMRGDTNHIFMKLQENQKYSQLSSFLLWSKKYGLERSQTTLYNLVDEFAIDDALRRRLKQQKVAIEYETLKTLEVESTTFEIGKTKLSGDDFSLELLRVRLQ